MRNLKYGLVALTPMLGAAGFAQGLSAGMTDGVLLQAQATQSSPTQDSTSGKPGADRDSGSNRTGAAGTGMGEETKLNSSGANAVDPGKESMQPAEHMSDPTRAANGKPQARKQDTHARKPDKKSKTTSLD